MTEKVNSFIRHCVSHSFRVRRYNYQVDENCRKTILNINTISVIEQRTSVSGALSSGINVALTGHPRRYEDTPFSRYRPPRRKKNTKGGQEEAKRTMKKERERKKEGGRKIEGDKVGRQKAQGGADALCVPVSAISLLHRGLGMPFRNLCLLYGQENKEASY